MRENNNAPGSMELTEGEKTTKIQYNSTITKTEQGLCSGYGQWHSPNNKENPLDYVGVTLSDIKDMVTAPTRVAKEEAQWFIPSTFHSRVHSEQREEGHFCALWADIDKPNGMTFEKMVSQARVFLNGFLAYTSRSATIDNQKARIIVQLPESVSGEEFVLMQKILNDKLEAQGIIPDRATERAGQVCYLPNEGKYYKADDQQFHWTLGAGDWNEEIAQEQERIQAEESATKERREQARLKATKRMESGCESPIDAYNAEYDLLMMLDAFGYIPRGKKWLSPNSESGVPGVTITDDGRKWLSAHGSDTDIGRPTNNGTMGDAFDLFVYYQHNGNRDAAIKNAGEMFTVGGVSLSKANQISYMETQGFDIEAENAPTPTKNLSFSSFALNGKTKELRKKMDNDVYIVGKLAIKGQLTGVYAPPNGGKTLMVLRLLADAVTEGRIDGSKVYYINADDNLRGGVDKTDLVEGLGIQMIIPTPDFDLKAILEYQIRTDTVDGGIIILDTLKKYVDVMRKSAQSEFFKLLRQYTAKNGTVVFLGHTNKRKEAGSLLRAGTDDAHQDSDCDWMLEPKDSTDGIIYTFINTKSRGDVPQKVTYFSPALTHDSYEDRFHGIEPVEGKELQQRENKIQVNEVIKRNHELVTFVKESLAGGSLSRGEIYKLFKESGKLAKLRYMYHN
jgi:hypothetical protein